MLCSAELWPVQRHRVVEVLAPPLVAGAGVGVLGGLAAESPEVNDSGEGASPIRRPAPHQAEKGRCQPGQRSYHRRGVCVVRVPGGRSGGNTRSPRRLLLIQEYMDAHPLRLSKNPIPTMIAHNPKR